MTSVLVDADALSTKGAIVERALQDMVRQRYIIRAPPLDLERFQEQSETQDSDEKMPQKSPREAAPTKMKLQVSCGVRDDR